MKCLYGPLLLFILQFDQVQAASSFQLIDSIQQEYITADSEIQKAYLSTEICHLAQKLDHPEMFFFCKKAAEESQLIKNDSLQIVNLVRLAYKIKMSDGINEAEPIILKAVDIAKKEENEHLIPAAYDDYVSQILRVKDKSKAMSLGLDALAIAEKYADNYYIYRLSRVIGILYYDSSLYEKATAFFQRGLEAACLVGEEQYFEMVGYLGYVKAEIGDLDLARNYFSDVIEYFENSDNIIALKKYYKGMANVESFAGDYIKSNQYLEKIFTNSTNKLFDARHNKQLYALNFFRLGKPKKALSIYQELESYFPQIDDDIFRYFVNRKIAEAYGVLGNSSSSYAYYEKSLNLRDSLFDIELKQATEAISIESKLKIQESENEVLQLKQEKEKKETSLKLYQWILFSLSILGLLLLASFALYRQRIKSKKLKELKESQELINEELSTKNEELDAFARIAAHDIKSPLRTTASFVQLLKRKIPQDERTDEIISLIENSVKKVSLLTDDLLSFARSGNYDTEAKPVDVDDIIKNVKSNLRQEILDSGAIIHTQEKSIQLLIHSNALIQLFQNIIANAIKFTNKETQPIIQILKTINSEYVVIEIIDNGIGMEQEFLDAIFLPLKKLNAENEFEGSGLGLATCKKIVEYYAGTLVAESKHGTGSKFIICFPKRMLVNQARSLNTNTARAV